MAYRKLKKNYLLAFIELPFAEICTSRLQPTSTNLFQLTLSSEGELPLHQVGDLNAASTITLSWSFTTSLERNTDFKTARDFYSQIYEV